MGTIGIVAGIFCGLGTAALLFKPFFGDAEGFSECLWYSLKPDILSWLNGEGIDDWWAETKLGIWLLCGSAVGYGVFVAVMALTSAP